MGSVLLAARVLLVAVFATAAVAKLRDRPGSRRSLADFGVPAKLLPLAAVLLPLAELATAIALVPTPSARTAAAAALVLLLAFSGGVVSALSHGQAPDCHCFGQLHSAPAGRGTIARNGALAALAAVVLIEGPGPAIDSWIAARTAAEVVAVPATIGALALTVLALLLRTEIGRLRRELAEARQELALLPTGLPVGAAAPRFTLPTLSGTKRSLQSLLERDRPLVLVFMSPDCATCEQLLPEVGRWQSMLTDRLSIAVVTDGTAAHTRTLTEEHGIHDVLLQQDPELMKAFRITLTPTAVVVTPEGRIGSTLAEGPLAIEPLIRVTLRRNASTGAAGGVAARQPA